MKVKKYPKRFEFRLSEEELYVLREIAKVLKTSDADAVRICIWDYWEKV